MATYRQAGLTAFMVLSLACIASAERTCPDVQGIFYRNLDANYWASPPGQALCRKVLSSSVYRTLQPAAPSLCGSGSVCDCVALKGTSLTEQRQAVQQVSALLLDKYASMAELATRSLPLVLNMYQLKTLPGCNILASVLGSADRVALSDVASALADLCTPDSYSHAGRCAAAITSALQCTKDCTTDIGCEVRGYLKGTITPYKPTTTTTTLDDDAETTTTLATGWVSRTLNRVGEFYLTTSDTTPVEDRLQVTIPVAPAGSLFNMRLVNVLPVEGISIPPQATLGGGIGGLSVLGGNIIPCSSSRSYAFLAAVQAGAAGPAVSNGQISLIFPRNGFVQSSIWTIQPNSNQLTAQWINSDTPALVTPTLFHAVEPDGAVTISYLALIGNLGAFCVDNLAIDCVLPGAGSVTLQFVPA